MSYTRKMIGTILLAISPFIIVYGYSGPSGTRPSHGLFIIAGAVALTGVLFLMPWLLRWLQGK